MSISSELTVPDIGDFENIPVIEILVKPGNRVQKDAPLVVLESDKATLDVPSSRSGVIKTLQVAIGDRVSFGSVIAIIESEDGDPVGTTSPSATTAPPVRPPRSEVAAATAPTVSQAPDAAVPPQSNLATLRGFNNEVPSSVQSTHESPVARLPRASPSIRRAARELGVDLTAVKGSGPSGRILKTDLQSYVRSTMTAPLGGSVSDGCAAHKLEARPRVDFTKFGPTDRVELSKIRKISGENLARNWVTIPHVTNFEDADISTLEVFRKQVNAQDSSGKAKITILAFLIKAAAVVLAKFPEFNSSLDGEDLVLKHYYHIGFAADTPQGLVVPVIRDVHTKGIVQIAQETAALAGQAREGKLKLADMQGGCFTISSLGGIGGTGFTPIINAPEVAILGVTRAQMRPTWTGNEFQPRLILPLALSWDHRVVDGAAAARFLIQFANLLSDFRRVAL